MKILSSYLGLFVLVPLLFFACNGSNQQINKPNEITHDTLRIARKYHLDNDSMKPYCSLDIEYIYPTKYANQDVLSKLQQELSSLLMEDATYAQLNVENALNKYIDDYIKNYKQEIELYHSHIEEDGDATEGYFSFTKTLKDNIIFNQDNLIVYQITAVDSKSNTDTLTTYYNLVVNLANGNRITEEDIFKPEYKKALNSILISKVVSQNNAHKPEDLFEMGYWGAEDIASNNNFSVDTKGITYIFNQGEYSAPRLGRIVVFLPYHEIAHLLKENSPISIFAKN